MASIQSSNLFFYLAANMGMVNSVAFMVAEKYLDVLIFESLNAFKRGQDLRRPGEFFKLLLIFVKTIIFMFEGADFPKSLDEDIFDHWLERGRESKLNYSYMLILWDSLELEYQPVYVESRDELNSYSQHKISIGRESLVAAYDLYSESRIF